MTLIQRVGRLANTVVRPLVVSPRWGRLFQRWMTVITYTGRKSGKTFSIPVSYIRNDDNLIIPVEVSEQKRWWRNFTGEGGPVHVRIDGVDRPGEAVAFREERGVVVRVRLLEP